MKGVFNLYEMAVGERKDLGEATLSTFEFKHEKNPLYNLRSIFDNGGLMRMDDGNYVRLHVGGKLQMSDTKMEKDSNREFVRRANGRVFIAGLGLGLIIHNLRDKIKDGTVTEIVVVEKYQDVVDLISPYFEGLPITYIVADIFDYRPAKDEKFDTIYFDIWPEICQDNLSEIATLHQRAKYWKNRENPEAWLASWMQGYLRRERAKDQRERYSYW